MLTRCIPKVTSQAVTTVTISSKIYLHFARLTLLRYVYNEPCKGKYQCDRESAGAKQVVNSYIESAHDILSDDDIYDALHYGSGLRKVTLLEINSSDSNLSGPTISAINSYLSQYFTVTWDCIDIIILEMENLWNITLIKVLSKVLMWRKNFIVHQRTSKSWKRKMSPENLFFFVPNLYAAVCLNKRSMNVSFLAKVITMLLNRQRWIKWNHPSFTRWKFLLLCTKLTLWYQVKSSEMNVPSACEVIQFMSCVSKQGWAIPKRTIYLYTPEQKNFIYDVFIAGEETGKRRLRSKLETSFVSIPHQLICMLRLPRYESFFQHFQGSAGKGTLQHSTQPKIMMVPAKFLK